MEWQQVGRRTRRHGAVRGGGGGPRPEVAQLAQELRAALMPRPHVQGHAAYAKGNGFTGGLSQRERKPEWQCTACGTKNFMDRTCCRRCAVSGQPGSAQVASSLAGTVQGKEARTGQRGTLQPRLPPGSVWASPARKEMPPRTLAAKATALDQALAAAWAAGASQDALAALRTDVAGAKQEAADTRPLGARLDSARAKVLRAATKASAAEEAVRQAVERQQAASVQQEEAQAELNSLLAQMPGDGEPAILQGARALLQALEQSSGFVAGTGPSPERVLEAMRTLQQAIGEPREEDIPAMELDPESEQGDEGPGSSAPEAPEAPQEPRAAVSVAVTAREVSHPLPAEMVVAELQRLGTMDDTSYAAAVKQALVNARAAPY